MPAKTNQVRISRAERIAIAATGTEIKKRIAALLEDKATALAYVEANRPAEPVEDANESELDLWAGATEAVYEAAGYYEILKKVRVAEEELVNWAEESMKRVIPTDFPKVADAFRLGRSVAHQSKWGQLVTICMNFTYGS